MGALGHEPSQNSGNQDLWKYLGLGTQLTATVVLFVGAGWWIDAHFGCSPWGILVGGVLGIVAGLYQFLKAAVQ